MDPVVVPLQARCIPATRIQCGGVLPNQPAMVNVVVRHLCEEQTERVSTRTGREAVARLTCVPAGHRLWRCLCTVVVDHLCWRVGNAGNHSSVSKVPYRRPEQLVVVAGQSKRLVTQSP